MDHNDFILVTGASGFIGGRLVELLAQRGLRVRAAISSARNVARISRLNVEVVEADLADHAALSRAVADCSVVFHVAYRFGGTTKQQKINLDGSRILAEAFLKEGGRRFLHVSSMSAYGDPCDGKLTEHSPQRSTREPYSSTKQDIERLLINLHRSHGLPVTILQPAIVYGPHGSIWTTPLLKQVRTMRIALPGGGLGLCNAVYVDDVVSALIAAADCDRAVGEKFLISGPRPVTWREFYRHYENMVGKSSVIDPEEAESLFQKSILRRLSEKPPQKWLLAAARRCLPGNLRSRIKRGVGSLAQRGGTERPSRPEVFVPQGQLYLLYASKTHIHIDKARALLGYEPGFDLNRGMAYTADWARSANLLAL
jgi:nucleoside-diphosphate-sugar epimerase